MSANQNQFIYALPVQELEEATCRAVQLNGHVVALYHHDGEVYAVDNRCPHMGFPLDKGTVKDGILTCNWHYARFDLESGGTFDQWADDVRAYPTEIRGDEVWVDLSTPRDPKEHQRERLQVGLERNLSLVLGKAVLVLLDNDGDPVEPFQAGVEFGCNYRWQGWGQGLTMHTCFMNMLPDLEAEQRPRALYHGLAAVAQDTADTSPRFPIRPLPNDTQEIPLLKRWFRQFIEVRDSEGAERCIISAIRAGATPAQMADMLFAAVTDHRYIEVGHPADFTNKAFEALDIIGWEQAETVLPALVGSYARADRMEESNAWRNPIDLIDILDDAFAQFDDVLTAGAQARDAGQSWHGRRDLVPALLDDNPQGSVKAMLDALRSGCTIEQLAGVVSYTAALRIAQFHTSNEFGDWDTALHTFTFANAIQHGISRAPSKEILRGVFDAAMSIYLDRFLNIPPAKLPQPNGSAAVNTLKEELVNLLNQQQQVNQSAKLVAEYAAHASADELLPLIGRLLLREDRDFHTIQCVEAAFSQYKLLRGTPEAHHVLIAAIRYLAAHAPTVRAQGQTYTIAKRLHQGDHLFEG